MKNDDKIIPTWIMVWNWTNLILLILCAIIYPLYLAYEEGNSMADIWRNWVIPLLVGMISSGVVSVIVASVAIKKKIKGLPDKLSDAIEKFDALGEHLNPDNRALSEQQTKCKDDLSKEHTGLSKEHSEIKQLAYNIDKAITAENAEQKGKYMLLDTSQRAIADSAEKIKGLSEQFQTLNQQLVTEKNKNAELQTENESLKAKNAELQQQINQQKNKSRSR